MSSCINRIGMESPVSVINSDRFLMMGIYCLVYPLMKHRCKYDLCKTRFRSRDAVCRFCPSHQRMIDEALVVERSFGRCYCTIAEIQRSNHCHICMRDHPAEKLWDFGRIYRNSTFRCDGHMILCEDCLAVQGRLGKDRLGNTKFAMNHGMRKLLFFSRKY